MHRWTVNDRCPCGGRFEDRLVEVRIASPTGGDPVTLEAVPQGACPSCGSRIYHAAMLQRLEALMAQVQRPTAARPV